MPEIDFLSPAVMARARNDGKVRLQVLHSYA